MSTVDWQGGHPVQVVSFGDPPRDGSRTSRTLILHTAAVTEISEKAGDCPIAIIAIAGAARRGKSFILSYLIRYLMALERSSTHDNDGAKGAGDWLDPDDPTKSMKDGGFQFQIGIDKVTNGIWMWSKPFIVQKGGSTLSILVMDTEGCFDPFTQSKEQSSIVSLSLLTSSSFIFNETSLINENTLTTLEKFISYGKLASQLFSGKCFQRLTFLVRDWTNPEFPSGAAGGRGYFQRYMNPDPAMSPEAISIRESLQDIFEHLDSYLLPLPGSQVHKKEFTGSVAEMGLEFSSFVARFVKGIVDDATPKKIACGTIATGSNLLELFSNYVDVLNGHDAPEDTHLFKANRFVLYEAKVTQFTRVYQDKIKAKIRGRLFLPLEYLQRIHDRTTKKVTKQFNETLTNCTQSDEKKLFERKLIELVGNFFEQIKEDLLSQEESLVESSENWALQHFQHLLNQSLSQQEFFEQGDFQQLIQQHGLECRTQFLSRCQNPLQNIAQGLVKNLFNKIAPIQNHFWDAMEIRRVEAESRLGDLLRDTMLQVYVERMEMDTAEYLQPSTLDQKHQKHNKATMELFTQQINSKLYPPTFLAKFIQQLETQVELQFEKFSRANREKLEAVVKTIEADVSHVIHKFDEEVVTILEDFGPSSAEAVRQSYQRANITALELVDKTEDMDAAQFNSLKRWVDDHLDEAFERAMGDLKNREDQTNHECNQMIKKSVDACVTDLKSFLEKEPYLNPKNLAVDFDRLVTTTRSRLSDDLLAHFKLDKEDRQKYLIQFDTHLEIPMGHLTRENIIKSQEASQMAPKLVASIEAGCWSVMCQFLGNVNRDGNQNEIFRELEEAQKGPVAKATRNFDNGGVWNKEDAELFKGQLFQALAKQLEKAKEIIEVELRRSSMVRDGVKELTSKFKSKISSKVTSHPFYTDGELEDLQKEVGERLLNNILEKLHNEDSKIEESFERPPRNISQDMNQGLQTVKLQMTPQLSECRENARCQLDHLIGTWVKSFGDDLDSIWLSEQSFETSIQQIQNMNQTLQTKFIQTFEGGWSYGDGSSKNKYLADLRGQMEQIFETIYEKLLKQRQDTHSCIHDLVTKSMINVQMMVDQEKIFDPQFLQVKLATLGCQMRIEFDDYLKSMNIKPACALAEFERQKTKLKHVVVEVNSHNCDVVKTELTNLLTMTVENGKDDTRSEVDLQNLVQFASSQAEEFVEGKKAELTDPLHDINSHVRVTVNGLRQRILTELQNYSEIEKQWLIDAGIASYKEEMKHYMQGKLAIPKHDLLGFHEQSSESALQQLRIGSFVGETLKADVLANIEKTFGIMRDQNDLERGDLAKTSAIGIDLGTTTCCVAVFQKGQPHIIPDKTGLRSETDKIGRQQKPSAEPYMRTFAELFRSFPQFENSFDLSDEENEAPMESFVNTASSPNVQGSLNIAEASTSEPPAGTALASQGHNLTPSYVHFPQNGEPIVGLQAKQLALQNSNNTVYNVKRLMGRPYADPDIQNDKKNWPFTVSRDVKKMAQIVIRGRGYSPQEISAELLKHEKKLAEDYLDRTVTQAVITVPANFNESQKEATRQAAQLAGLEVLQIINEPTAAAIAHALNWKDEERIVLIFDFGGGTIDVTILKTRNRSGDSHRCHEGKEGPSMQVLLTRGDAHLGGVDFDTCLVEFCVQEFQRIHDINLLEEPDRDGHHSVDAQINKKIIRLNERKIRLWTECERVKQLLTTQEEAVVSVDNVIDELDLSVSISREKFEELNEHLFQKAIDIVQEALEAAQVPSVSDVIMVGGSSKIPKVKLMLSQVPQIPHLNLDTTIDVQEAVALGAAVQACILSGDTQSFQTATLPSMQDVQPFIIGIDDGSGEMLVIVRKDCSRPCEESKTYRISSDNHQEVVPISIYAGDNKFVADNRRIGCFTLAGIPKEVSRPQIKVTIQVDESGVIRVRGTCVGTSISRELTVGANRMLLIEA